MDVGRYYESLADELRSLQDRVRHLIDTAHWPTDGEAKESYLRTILRRHLPQSVSVGRGFVIVEGGKCSSQIDILIYDDRTPRFYCDGDLAFVPADGVLGIIEVKTTPAKFKEAAEAVANNAKLIRNSMHRPRPLFVGMFFYTSDLSEDAISTRLDILRNASGGSKHGIINHVAIGDSHFVKFWAQAPDGLGQPAGWRAYRLNRRAAGYFINNAVLAMSPTEISGDLLFPPEGKETQCFATRSLDPEGR